MSMYDKSFCGTDCEQKDCERNLKYHKPTIQIYSVANLDENNPDKTHKNCKYKIPGNRSLKL